MVTRRRKQPKEATAPPRVCNHRPLGPYARICDPRLLLAEGLDPEKAEEYARARADHDRDSHKKAPGCAPAHVTPCHPLGDNTVSVRS